MVATWNPSAESGYYTKNYYVGTAVAADAWFAPADTLGVTTGALIEKAIFARLFEGLGTDGRSLVNKATRRDRVPAFDMTLSAPRSVSLVWALAAPDLKSEIEQAQRRAAMATLAILDSEAAFARRGKGGQALEKVGFTAAMFLHGDSRPARHDDGRHFADPNLHSHSVILNLATRADGSCGAIHSAVLRDHKMACGATYHAALAFELQSLGFHIDRVGKNGVFEIAGVPANVIEYFSARRNEIQDELARSGTTTATDPALASAVAKSTRGAKAQPADITREDVWKDAAEQFQIRPDVFSNSLRETSIKQDAATAETSFAMRLAAALNDLTATDSVVRRQDVIRSVASALVGTGLPVERVPAEVALLVADGKVVQVGLDQIGRPLYSTPDLIAIEQSIVETASRLVKRRAFTLDPVVVERRCERDGLSAEQAGAVRSMTSGGGIAVVEGSAGSGKTTLLGSVVTSYQENHYRVIGAAMAWQTANALHRDLGIDAWSTASLLSQLNTGKQTLDERTILVVDEAGLIGSREMVNLLRAVDHAGAKAILVGDSRQLQPIGAGPALGIVADVVEAKRVDTIVRQSEAWARRAVADLRDGKAIEGLQAFSERGHVVEADGAKAAITAAVDAWQGSANGESTLLIAKTNLQVAALSREVRVRLRKSGRLRGEEIVIPATTPSGHAVEIALAVGDSIRFLVRNDDLRVVNGSKAVIIGISAGSTSGAPTNRVISIDATIGTRRITFRPEDLADTRGRALLSYAYATTIYGSQGLTVDHATVLLDGTVNRHEAYVATSRARHQTKLVVDCNAVDRQLKRDPLYAKQALAFTRHERLSWLATRVARENRKVSTVEVIAAETVRQAVAQGVSRKMVKTTAHSKSAGDRELEI